MPQTGPKPRRISHRQQLRSRPAHVRRGEARFEFATGHGKLAPAPESKEPLL